MPRSIGLVAVTLVLSTGVPSRAIGFQDLGREAVAEQLGSAERSRSCYRIAFGEKYLIDTPPSERDTTTYERVADGKGRVRRATHRPVSDMYGDASIVAWSAGGSTGRKYRRTDPTSPQLLSLQTTPPGEEHRDEIEISLGLRFFQSPRRPSEVVADKRERVIIRRRGSGEDGLVEVVFVGPSFFPSAVITNVYDPSRQWALVEKRTIASTVIPVEAEEIEPANISASIRYEMTGWQRSNGVWVPTRIEDHTVFRPGTAREEKAYGITELTSVEINPPLRDEDFIIPTDNLPRGSTVTDGRLGISYKIGEDVLYMDGHLNQLTAPVTQVITAEMLPEVMKGAVAMVPPEAATLASVESGMNWWKWGGIGFFAAGAIALAAILWMRRRAAA